MVSFEGGCHCGAIKVRFTTDQPAASLVPRADQCGFCRKHNAAVISDPAGHLDITIAERAGAAYRFGFNITDFHLCNQCGVFVAATGIGDDELRGVVNIHVLQDREQLAQSPMTVSFDGESVVDRQARRRVHWTPASVTYAVDGGQGINRS
jgi:hypothetical protein